MQYLHLCIVFFFFFLITIMYSIAKGDKFLKRSILTLESMPVNHERGTDPLNTDARSDACFLFACQYSPVRKKSLWRNQDRQTTGTQGPHLVRPCVLYFLHTNTHTHTHTNACARTHTHTHAHIHTRPHTRTLARTHIHTHALTHVHTHTHTRARARAHTHTQKKNL